MGLFNLILVFAFGFVLHCPAMCGPVVAVLYPDERLANRFHVGRILGYSSLGGFAGLAGSFIYTTGYAALGIFAFIALSILLLQKRFKGLSADRMVGYVPKPMLLGVLFTFIPCHYLWTMAGLAAISGSAATGALLMFCHGVLSALGIRGASRSQWVQKFRQKFPATQHAVFAASVLF